MSKTTALPIAAIYYGTSIALRDALKVNAGRIDWAHWLEHKPESQPPRVTLAKADKLNQERKPHIHLLIQPKGRVSLDLVQAMIPPDADGRSLLAIKSDGICRNISEWLLYCTHRQDYLVDAKGLKPKLNTYGWDAFDSTDFNRLQEQVNEAEDHLDRLLTKQRRREAVQALAADLTKDWTEVLRACHNPAEEIVAYRYRQATLDLLRAHRAADIEALKESAEPRRLSQRDLLRDPSDDDPTEP